MEELKKSYLTEQIITYLGNKRTLLSHIKGVIDEIKPELNKEDKDIIAVDLFAGSGVVGRMLKECGFQVISNDLEGYSHVINSCYLSNKSEFNEIVYNGYYEKLKEILENKKYVNGIISENYAPKNDDDIQEGERAFYTSENAKIIDTIRAFIDTVEEPYKKYFMAVLLYEASVHTNTSGVFKGFYKSAKTGIGKFGGDGENALSRIKGKIEIEKPILSDKENKYTVYQKDANVLVKELKDLDIVYMDPPYNQHPYASNYFMLNVILNNKIEGKMSKVSGIPDNWNRSAYNKRQEVKEAIDNLVKDVDCKYLVVSYNSEGFVSLDDMKEILGKYGEITVKEIQYNAFRGSRNLKGRDIYVDEYLFILKKNKKDNGVS